MFEKDRERNSERWRRGEALFSIRTIRPLCVHVYLPLEITIQGWLWPWKGQKEAEPLYWASSWARFHQTFSRDLIFVICRGRHRSSDWRMGGLRQIEVGWLGQGHQLPWPGSQAGLDMGGTRASQVAQLVKNPPAMWTRRSQFNSWVGKICWRREWLPTLAFLPGEFHQQGSLESYSPWGFKEWDMTEPLSLSGGGWQWAWGHTRPFIPENCREPSSQWNREKNSPCEKLDSTSHIHTHACTHAQSPPNRLKEIKCQKQL